MADRIKDALIEAMSRVVGDTELTDDQTQTLMASMLDAALPRYVADLVRGYRRTAKKMLKAEASEVERFTARNARRWRRPLDELEIMLRVAEEAGSELVEEWAEGDHSEPYKFAALNHLFVKAQLATREIIWLITGGYADGAMARWRTLHELAVFAAFLSEKDERISQRFVASFDFKALKAARQVNEFAERAGLERFTDAELADMAQVCADHTAELGNGLGEEYGWARPALVAKRLEDLEKATGLDHWRPRYRWASQNIHGGFRPAFSSLGMSEADIPIHLVGPSNSGMVDPLQMTAISLGTVSAMFLTHRPNLERTAIAESIRQLSVGVGPLAARVEKKSAAAAAKRRAKGAKRAE